MAPIAKKTYSRRKNKLDDEGNINDSDPFDKLLSSPLKQNVDFKPLSFWRNKSSGGNHIEKPKTYCHNVSDSSSIASPNTRKLKELWLNLRAKTRQKVSKSVNSKSKKRSGNPELSNPEASVSRGRTKANRKNYESYDGGKGCSERSPEINIDHYQFITIKRSIDYDFSKGCLDVNNNIPGGTSDPIHENCSTPGDTWKTYILDKKDEVSDESRELQSGDLETYVVDEIFEGERGHIINGKDERLNPSYCTSNVKTQVRSDDEEKLHGCDLNQDNVFSDVTRFYCDGSDEGKEENNFDFTTLKFEKEAKDDDDTFDLKSRLTCNGLDNLSWNKAGRSPGSFTPSPGSYTVKFINMMKYSRSGYEKSFSPPHTMTSCFSPIILLENDFSSSAMISNDSYDDVYEATALLLTNSKSVGEDENGNGDYNGDYCSNCDRTPIHYSLGANPSFGGARLRLEEANSVNESLKSSLFDDSDEGLHKAEENPFQYADVDLNKFLEESFGSRSSHLMGALNINKGKSDVIKKPSALTACDKRKESVPEFCGSASVFAPEGKESYPAEFRAAEELERKSVSDETFSGIKEEKVQEKDGRRNTVEYVFDGNGDYTRRKFFRCPRVKKQGSSKSSCTYSDKENDDSIGHGLNKEGEKRHSEGIPNVPATQIKSLITGVSDLKLSCSSPIINDNSILNDISVSNNIISPVIKVDSVVQDLSTMGLSRKTGKPVKPHIITVTTRRRDNKASQNKISMAYDNRRVTRARDTLKSLGPPKFNSTMIGRTPTVPGSRVTNVSLNVSRFSGVPNPLLESTRIDQYDHNCSAMSPLEKTTCSETSVVLIPGKKWQRSVSVLRKIQNDTQASMLISKDFKGRHYDTFVKELKKMQEEISEFEKTGIEKMSDQSSNITVLDRSTGTRLLANETTDETILKSIRKPSKRGTLMGHTVKIMDSLSLEKSAFRTAMEFQNNVTVLQGAMERSLERSEGSISARDVIMHQCDQLDVLPFEEYFNEKTLKNCRKIGEGVFGEVFTTGDTVFKVIPIEGDQEVNGEPQKKFEEILSEVIIASKLSDLREAGDNQSPGFSKMIKCWCVIGKYPKFLLDLWNEYDLSGSGSENDSPQMFTSDQQYIVLELENGGKDLESFVFNSAEQSMAIFIQAAFTLAVAERVLEFEHRDLHWGNLLISRTTDKFMRIALDGVEYDLPTKGVKVAIIDFTLSRIRHEECCLFNDLSVDPTLFASQGDYQFEIYRMMHREVGNDWSLFRPKTNIFWLHYILDKMLKMVRYKNKNTQVHKKYIKEIKVLESVILEHESSADFVISMGLGS